MFFSIVKRSEGNQTRREEKGEKKDASCWGPGDLCLNFGSNREAL